MWEGLVSGQGLAPQKQGSTYYGHIPARRGSLPHLGRSYKERRSCFTHVQNSAGKVPEGDTGKDLFRPT